LKLRTITPSTKESKVLKQSDIMRLVANKDIRLRTSGLNHNPQQRVKIMNADGIYEYSDEELAGYLSPGESTYRIQAGLLDLVIKAAHAETPTPGCGLHYTLYYTQLLTQTEHLSSVTEILHWIQIGPVLPPNLVRGLLLLLYRLRYAIRIG
jgi:hypothetical protein